MRELRPAFYDRFACLADRCRHSCCRGWEIDVDEDSARYYRSLSGALGDELRAALRQENGVRFFALTEAEDCPFLRRDGLCRLYAELGEDALCDICALHPRFFAEVRGYRLSGLGLSCEAATALLLSEPLLFLTDGGEELTLSALLRLLGEDTPREALRFTPTVDAAYYRALLERCAACEALDEAWTQELASLSADPERAAADAAAFRERCDPALPERAFGYVLFRQLERLEEHGLAPLLRFAREAADLVFLVAARSGDLPEALRRWSAEVEYSDENVDRLLQGRRE